MNALVPTDGIMSRSTPTPTDCCAHCQQPIVGQSYPVVKAFTSAITYQDRTCSPLCQAAFQIRVAERGLIGLLSDAIHGRQLASS